MVGSHCSLDSLYTWTQVFILVNEPVRRFQLGVKCSQHCFGWNIKLKKTPKVELFFFCESNYVIAAALKRWSPWTEGSRLLLYCCNAYLLVQNFYVKCHHSSYFMSTKKMNLEKTILCQFQRVKAREDPKQSSDAVGMWLQTLELIFLLP